MPRAICEDCGSMVAAEVTHNGVCAVGHYVHCGWGHQLLPDDLISDDIAQIIADLEDKLEKAMEGLLSIDALDPEALIGGCSREALGGLVNLMGDKARATLAEISSHNKGESHD